MREGLDKTLPRARGTVKVGMYHNQPRAGGEQSSVPLETKHTIFFATFPQQSIEPAVLYHCGRAAKQVRGKAGLSSHLERVIAWCERNLNAIGGRYSSLYHLSSPSQATQGWNCRKGQGQHSQGTEGAVSAAFVIAKLRA